MLTRTGHALPAELYSVIFSYLRRHDLVQISKACRILFNAAVPHFWRKVDLGPLLALLPESCFWNGGEYELGTTDIQAFTENYHARYALYKPCVEILNVTSQSKTRVPSKGFMDHQLANMYTDTIDRIELPSLNKVDTHYRWFTGSPGGSSQQLTMIWMLLMVPPTLKHLSFTAAYQQDLPILRNLLARCPRLTQLEFSPDQRPDWDTWDQISVLPIAHELTTLDVRCAEIGAVGYSWISKLPKLQHLKLYFGQHYGELPQPGTSPIPTPVAYPQAFSELRNVYISVDEEELRQIIPIWQTIGMHVTHVTIETWDRVCTLDIFAKLFSGLTTNCPKVSFFYMREYVPGGTEVNAPRLPVSHLSMLQMLPLRVLRIDRPLALDDGCGAMKSVGALFPELEELWLEDTPITAGDLLQAAIYLPRIRRLRLCLHIVVPTLAPLSSILGDNSQDLDEEHIPYSQLTLKFYTGAGLNGASGAYGAEDWDFIARVLTARWSSVTFIQSYDGMFYQHFFKVDDKFAFHSSEHAKRRRTRERGQSRIAHSSLSE